MMEQPPRSTDGVPDASELAEWLNTQAQTPIGGLILFVLVYGARLYLRDLMERLDRPKKKKKKATNNG